jgi:hypothetical protein
MYIRHDAELRLVILGLLLIALVVGVGTRLLLS